MRAVARRLGGDRSPLAEYARECLGLEPRWLPEQVFEQAHAELDAAPPKGPGSLGGRLRAWQAAHTLEPIERLPELVSLAVAEARARTTAAVVPLPEGEVVACRLVEGVPCHAAGAYEGHPGHIAESVLKELGPAGREDQRVRFMVSPSFVNVLWGVWGDVALLADEGRREGELGACLARWALYSEEAVAMALPLLRPSPSSPYGFGYFQGGSCCGPG
ncbi:hypothetical protein MF672_043215 [Actinomadura sp. ATCC 31491]|uniref:Uncharacterized protein n=1 Tax=Actinomadura luzonensis TaxID=2805427 RepID=A0ABT0G7K3_9ACTN|nr:hypothetical protein [Actinomadura luzonensis]MCK2220568.1 hypothetical protein [Actinomadura luzonensis]